MEIMEGYYYNFVVEILLGAEWLISYPIFAEIQPLNSKHLLVVL